MNNIKLVTPNDFNFADTAVGGNKNFLLKYDKQGDAFKVGFMAKRENPGPGELVFYPVWITKIEIAPVMRQMFGNELVDTLMTNPQRVYWLDCWLNGTAMPVLEQRQARAREYSCAV